MRIKFILLSLLGVQSVIASTLCHKAEVVFFSCNIKQKQASMCIDKQGTLTYRYGTPEKVEMELNNPVKSIGSLGYTGQVRYRFSSGQYSYIFYQKDFTGGGLGESNRMPPSVTNGIAVTKKNKKIAELKCADEIVKGSPYEFTTTLASKIKSITNEEYDVELEIGMQK